MQKKNILYFYTAESPFIEKDIAILSLKSKVIRFHFNLYDKKRMLLILLKQFFFLLRNILSSELIVCQFAGLHAFLPVLFAKIFFKKSVVVAGGTDCVGFPSINYGNFANKKNATLTRFCFKNTSLIFPVHESLVLYDYTYQPNDFPQQGIKYFIPELKTQITTIYNGYDSEYWKNTVGIKEISSFITVLGHMNSRFTMQLKGIDLFISLCNSFPYSTFTIVGGNGIKLSNKPANLQLLTNIWGRDLVDLFSRKQFYVQLSMSEGFPNALSEAMLCECVPLVSNVGGMPDIVSGHGYILYEKDEEVLKNLVKEALANPFNKDLGKKSREEIKNHYSVAKRQEKFLKEIERIFS